MINFLTDKFKNQGIDYVAVVESRGFVFGAALAYNIDAGCILVRKPGKLPAETVEVSYAKEYGMDVIQIHKDALNENDVVLIHDDILATGGTMDAAIQLVKKMGVKTIYVDFILELVGLNGRALLEGKADELNCLFDMEVDE
jgi:adenine phosphoribosyltransferase